MYNRKKLLSVIIFALIPILFLVLVEAGIRIFTNSFSETKSVSAQDIVCSRPWKKLGFVIHDEQMGWKLNPNFTK